MATTDATLRTTIKQLFSEDNSSNGDSMISSLSEDPLDLDALIGEVLPDAVAHCSKAAPLGGVNLSSVGIFPDGSVITRAAIIDDDGVVTLPTDYVRMNWLILSTPLWAKRVYSVTDPGSALAEAQYNSFTTSKEDNPVVVGTTGTSGKGLIVFPHATTIPAQGSVGTLCYEKKYDSTNGLATDNEDYVMAVCHMAVSLLYEVFERGDAAERHKAIAVELITG